jgi:hypothetical protein
MTAHLAFPCRSAKQPDRFAFNAKINSSLLQDRDAFVAMEYALVVLRSLRHVCPKILWGSRSEKHRAAGKT